MKMQHFALVLAGMLATSPVLAQQPPAQAAGAGQGPSAQDLAIAEAAFNEGVKLAQEGKWQEAIAKLELSMKMDPAAGTARNLGKCYAEVGRTASAYGAYSQAAGLARIKVNEAIRTEAEAQMAALAPTLSKIELRVASPSVPGLVIAIDGKPLSADALGVAVPVDPGTRQIEASAPGKKPWKTSVVVAAKPGTTPVDIPALEDAPAPAPPPAADPGMPLGAKVAAIGLAGAGAIALGIGIGFGVDSLDKNAASKKLCDAADETRCSAAGADLRDKAFASATASNVGIGVGAGALVAAGGVLLVSRFVLQKAPAKDAAVTAVDVGPGGVVVRGQW